MCIESSGNETAGKPHIHLIHCGQLSVSDNNFIMLQQNIRLSGATVVVTGAAGFIDASLTRRLLDEYPDCRVIGIDNITDYGVSEALFRTGLCLPSGPCVTDDDVRYIVDNIKAALID